MHLSISVPHPIAHLARILMALEEARCVAEPGAQERRAARYHSELVPGPRVGLGHDLEDISLLGCEPAPERPADSLALFSLSCDGEETPGEIDGLNTMGLLWSDE